MSTRTRNKRAQSKYFTSEEEQAPKNMVSSKTSSRKTKKSKSTGNDQESELGSFEEDDTVVSEIENHPKNKKRKAISNAGSKKPVQSPKKKMKVDDEEYTEVDSSSKGKQTKVYDSDALDEDSDADTKYTPKKRNKTASRRKSKKQPDDSGEFDDLEEGQEIVGRVVQAPTTGHAPPGQVSRNTLDFLQQLKDPACNDRQWFKLREPIYRLAETEWKAFIEAFTDKLIEVDTQIPALPPKDVIHRIYRDIRFSNDKTPYKTHLSASFSRSGRKGIFAHYHISVEPGNKSLIAAGCWCPGRSELANIRTNIHRSSRRLRNVISAPDFVKLFGKAKPHPKGEHQNIFGMEDELKTAPKGVDKEHKDIDLLKCRSFCVIHRFLDSEVLDPNFQEKLAEIAAVMTPFVHCLNDMMTIIDNTNNSDNDDTEDDQDDA